MPVLRISMILQIRRNRAHLTQRRLRLIHSGRLLSDGTFVYAWLSTLEERQARSLTDKSISFGSGSPTTASSTLNNTVWLHCSVGPVLTESEDDDAVPQGPEALHQLRGFDRLRTAGFSEEDIANMRRQFHLQHSGSYLDSALASESDCK